jgi:hypothetical protein
VTLCEIRSAYTEADISSSLFGFPLLIIIPPLHHTLLSSSVNMCDSLDHAAHYHNLSLEAGRFISVPHDSHCTEQESIAVTLQICIRVVFVRVPDRTPPILTEVCN